MTTEVDSPVFTLYGTSACHLCEIAEGILASYQQGQPTFCFVKVDISDSDKLFQRYGVLIPVLRHPGGSELGWPFTAGQLAQFVAA